MTIQKIDFTDQAYKYEYPAKWKSGFGSSITPDGPNSVFDADKIQGDNLIFAKADSKDEFDAFSEATPGNTTLIMVDDTAQGYFAMKVSRKESTGDNNTDDGTGSEAGGYYLDNRFSYLQSTDYSAGTAYDTGKLFFVNENQQASNGDRPAWNDFGQRVIDSRITYLLNKEDPSNPLLPFVKDLVTDQDLAEFAAKVNTGITREYATEQELLDAITAAPNDFAANQSFLVDAWNVSTDPQQPEFVRAVVSLNASKVPEYVYQYGGFDSSVLDQYQTVADAIADNASHLNDIAELEAKLAETTELLSQALEKLNEVDADVTNSESLLAKADRKLVRTQSDTAIDLDPSGNLVLYIENNFKHARLQTKDSQDLKVTMNVLEYFVDNKNSFKVKGYGSYDVKRDVANNKSGKIVLGSGKKGVTAVPKGARTEMMISFRPGTDGATLRHNAVYKVIIIRESDGLALVDISHYPSPDANQNNFAAQTFFDF